MTEPRYTEAELDAAVEALTEPERFREAETVVAQAAPKLHRILAKALALADDVERDAAVRTLLAEETRMGMLVGVAVGWALATELDSKEK